MKKIKKLTLKKETISILTGNEMKQRKGGTGYGYGYVGWVDTNYNTICVTKDLLSGKTCACGTGTCNSQCQTNEDDCNTGFGTC